MAASLGEEFARALAAKDVDRLVSLLHPEVDFRGMTPGRFWEASNAVQAVHEIVRSWFEDSDQIDELLQVETSRVADRERVGYRLAVTAAGAPTRTPAAAASLLRRLAQGGSRLRR